MSKTIFRKMPRKSSNFYFKKLGNEQHYRKAVVESSLISSFTCLEINVRSYCKPQRVHTTVSGENLCVHHKQELTTMRKLPRHWNSVLNSKPNASTKLSSHLSISIPDLNLLQGLTFSTLWHIFSRIKVPGWPIHFLNALLVCVCVCLFVYLSA